MTWNFGCHVCRVAFPKERAQVLLDSETGPSLLSAITVRHATTPPMLTFI